MKKIYLQRYDRFFDHTEIINDSRVMNNGETEVEILFFVIND
jgi:hypothetical protein